MRVSESRFCKVFPKVREERYKGMLNEDAVIQPTKN